MKLIKTIKAKVLLAFGLIILITIILAGWSIYSSNMIIDYKNDVEIFNQINIDVLELRRSEKDFLGRESRNQAFFETGESKHWNKHKELIKILQDKLDNLQTDKDMKELNIVSSIKEIRLDLTAYDEKFNAIAAKIKQRGYKDWGYEGELRATVHAVESTENNLDKILLLTLRRDEKDFFLRKELSYVEKFNAAAEKLKASIDVENGGKLQIEKIDSYKAMFAKIVQTEQEIGLTEKDGLMGEMRAVVNQIDPLLEEMTATVKSNTEEMIAKSRIEIMIIFLITIFLSILLAYLIIKSLITSLAEMNKYISVLTSGDLTAQMKMLGEDEISVAMGNMSKMVEKFKEVITSVMTSTNYLVSASVQMSSTSQQMSQGTQEQAASAEEISASMEEIAQNIQQNTDNALQTEKISVKAVEDMKEGSAAVIQTVDSMKKIAQKIGIIGEISRQTNLLALNAAVEAARAGEHGKGFAVVAAEVRKLAERSQLAAEEINELSASSVAIADKSGRLIEQVVPNIQNTAKLVQGIAISNSQQNKGSEQVNNSIQQLNQIIQENAAGAEEIAASSEELSAQADNLLSLISFFEIEKQVTTQKFSNTRKASPQIKTTHFPNPSVNGNGHKNVY
jgi:methyl-accepting chemotaxis protein